MSAPTAIVTDAGLRSAVAGIRGLGRGGIPVVALAARTAAAGRWSRFATAGAVTPDVLSDPGGFAAAVAAAAAAHGPAIVFPGREASLDALLDRDDVPLAYPRPDALESLRDKRRLADLAHEVGLGAPRTLAEGTVAELRGTTPAMPCVVKPARPGSALATACVVLDAAALADLLAGLPDDEQLLVQERATPPLRSVAMVMDAEGRVVEQLEQLTRRTFPPDAGISSLAVTVAPDTALLERCAALLRASGHVGLAHMQFVAAGGRPALIDVNPRFYGSLPLALAAGANLPAAWYAVATGAPWDGPSAYRVGASYRWLEGDLMAAVRGERGVLGSRGSRPRTGAVWASDDPRPGVILAGEALWDRALKRLGRPGIRR